MKREAGFTLVETLAGLLILTLIVTTSLAIFYDRQLRLKRAEETILAYQTLANEAEVQRRTSYAQLSPGPHVFLSDQALLSTIPDAKGSIVISQKEPGIRELILTLRWRQDSRSAQMTLIRTDTGGDNFW